MEDHNSTFITRVVIENYKSIEKCDVSLGPLMLLVGPNGSGKSNFLDALRFVSDALHNSLDHALRERGGIKEVCRRSGSRSPSFRIQIYFNINVVGLEVVIGSKKVAARVLTTYAEMLSGCYDIQVQAHLRTGYVIHHERCEVTARLTDEQKTKKFYYSVSEGKMSSNSYMVAPATKDRLYLVNAAGISPFRTVYDYLSRMAFYTLSPDRIRSLQVPDAGELLLRDGSNIASVLAQMNSRSKPDKLRIEEYLSKVAPSILGVNAKTVSTMETLEFRQQTNGKPASWLFPAASMSDGTLRALGVLVALFQSGGPRNRVPLVGIEEPEIALHPAATGVLLNSLDEASQNKQVLVTSHSPELLDSKDIKAESILAVAAENGVTKIGPIDAAGRFALREHLYTAGELLRLNQLAPDLSQVTAPEPLETVLIGAK